MKRKNQKHGTQCWASFRPEASRARPGRATSVRRAQCTPWAITAPGARWQRGCGRRLRRRGTVRSRREAPVEVGGCAKQGCGGLGLPMTRGSGEVENSGCAVVLDVGAEIPVVGDDGGVALHLQGVRGVSPWSRWGMESTGAQSAP
jgi:hypothetical protein